MKILALDYDGVVVDSMNDTFLVAYNAYLKNYQKDLYKSKKINIKNFNIDKWKEKINKYRKLRPLFNYAERWSPSAIELVDQKIETKQEFDKAIKKTVIDDKKFIRQLHEYRREIIKDNYEDWIKLTPLFDNIIIPLKKLLKEFKVVIVTDNDSLIVQKRLASAGIMIDKEDIYDIYFERDKKEKIKIIKNKFNVEYKDILFVDDMLNYLLNVKSLGVKCFLPVWGYNNKEHIKKSEKEGITLLTQDNFYKTLKKESK